eukprot:scaffold24813_cov69-Phaeocystis_antarctica.AAC.1
MATPYGSSIHTRTRRGPARRAARGQSEPITTSALSVVAAGSSRGEAGAEPLCLGARGRCSADVVEPRVGSFANGGGGRQAAWQKVALGISDAGVAGTDGHSRGVDQQQRTRAARLAAA